MAGVGPGMMMMMMMEINLFFFFFSVVVEYFVYFITGEYTGIYAFSRNTHAHNQSKTCQPELYARP